MTVPVQAHLAQAGHVYVRAENLCGIKFQEPHAIDATLSPHRREPSSSARGVKVGSCPPGRRRRGMPECGSAR